MNDVIEFIKDNNIGKYDEDVSLKKHCTYKVGGNCKLMVYPKDTYKLIALLKYLKSNNILYRIIGKGSNILFSNKEYNGVLIKLD